MTGITLTRGTASITLTSDLDMERQVGRPNSELRPQPSDLPKYIDKNRSASDVFEITGEFTSSTAESDATTLSEQIIRPPLGRGSITLDFSGLYGLQSYTVFPVGSQAGRVSYSAGEKGVVRVDALSLRVVDNS